MAMIAMTTSSSISVKPARARAGGRLADLLDSRQQQADQDGDDRDHDEQFDEGERTPRHSSPCETDHVLYPLA
jgi:hypothetical protein